MRRPRRRSALLEPPFIDSKGRASFTEPTEAAPTAVQITWLSMSVTDSGSHSTPGSAVGGQTIG